MLVKDVSAQICFTILVGHFTISVTSALFSNLHLYICAYLPPHKTLGITIRGEEREGEDNQGRMAFGFPPQSDVLFDSKWDADKDSCFIDIVVRDMEKNPTEKQANILIASLRRARKGLNERYCSKFNWDDVCSRYAKLKDRYRTFRSLIAQPGVYWDELANVVHADPTVWARVCEVR